MARSDYVISPDCRVDDIVRHLGISPAEDKAQAACEESETGVRDFHRAIEETCKDGPNAVAQLLTDRSLGWFELGLFGGRRFCGFETQWGKGQRKDETGDKTSKEPRFHSGENTIVTAGSQKISSFAPFKPDPDGLLLHLAGEFFQVHIEVESHLFGVGAEDLQPGL